MATIMKSSTKTPTTDSKAKTGAKKSYTSDMKKEKKNTGTASAKVKAKADAAKDLQDLFEDGLKDVLWAEKALLKALPKMEKNATSEKLKRAITQHIQETETHVQRLEACFESIGKKVQAEKCYAMEGLIEEGTSIMEETQSGAVRDAGIIATAQKLEHYEIATYGTLAAFAKVLEHGQVLKLLLQTLKEEKKCDEVLTSIADTNLNSKAE